MFLYTTTNLINSASDYEVVDNKLFRMKFGPTFKIADKNNIKVAKAIFKAETPDTVEIELPELDEEGTYRLNLYVRSMNNADPIYANNFVFKGKPFFVEFTGKMKAGDIVDIANKFLLAMYDHKQLAIEADGDTTVKISGINGYLRIFCARVEYWTPDATADHGHWETIQDNTEDVVVGCEGQGTYELILKDLRLPTADNLAYLNVNTLQMPIPGGEYTQFTVTLRKELKGYPGGIGIDNPVESVTNHVFFVLDALKDDFESALAAFAKDGVVEYPAPAEEDEATEDEATDTVTE